ncbi:MAG: peptidase M23 [Parcubacteria group bacterium Gr01-1014_3]|nr:MAG: peptidase M23 [Parcubacteria group bacterium Gr01-1014_3]
MAQVADAFSQESNEVSASEGAIFEEDFTLAEGGDNAGGFVLVDADSLLAVNNPLSTILPTRDGLIIYKVQKGDSLSKIAANFGISLNTIFWANQSVKNSIKPGQEIVILPVSGVLHQVEDGDTVDSLVELYGAPREKILKYNKIVGGYLKPGVTVVIPGANPKKGLTTVSVKDLPSYPGYFILPTIGWNWGNLHNYNAVDIANSCGTPVYAAAEGLVADAKSYGWNGGYGHYIEIEHPNKAITRYSHMQKNAVSTGDYVVQGDLIGYIGNTGNVHGPTGCHLHFEVRGARNPFAK